MPIRACQLGLLVLLCGVCSVQAATVHHVKIHTDGGMIDPGVAAFVKRVVRDAKEAEVDAIVFDINTFGGRVDSATEIRDAIFDLEMLTIAFVNRRAISAGALISLSCDKIVMTSGSSIGAATAVNGATGEKANDKTISYFRAEMRATAERSGRDPKIAEAMVDERVEILGLSEEAGRPATLTAEQALHYRIADETAETLYDVLRIYDLEDATIIEIEDNWAEDTFSLLTHPVVTSLLLAVAMFGLITEVRTPGWGLGGTLALLALALFFGSHYVVHLAEWDELLLFVVGLGLLGLEVFVIPGFGFVGLAGILCIAASLIFSQLGQWPTLSLGDISEAVFIVSTSMIGGIVLSFILMRTLPRFSAFRTLVLDAQTPAEEGYVSAATDHDSELAGQQGVTLTELRPVGIGFFDGQRLDIITEGEFIKSQAAVKTISARGSRVVVRPL